MGPNMFSSALHRVDTFVGVGLFSALVAYETHTSIKAYEEGNADHLMMSIDFALDFWNIFIRVAEILYMFSRNDWGKLLAYWLIIDNYRLCVNNIEYICIKNNL